MTPDDFRPCLLVPIFDHGKTIRGVVEALEPMGLPLLVVDDGSAEPTRRELSSLSDDCDWVRVEHHPHNRGRGAALRTGYRTAARLGYTHALQLDADGQHDVADVPRMLDAARSRPEALVLGRPVFDESAPKARLYGRMISQFWCWVECLGFDIADPLCGFRCFPLEATLAVLAKGDLGDRMDFDPEIAVRLVWEGVPVINVPTRVSYFDGGLSHFRVVVDSARIARAHVRLVLGMLLRAPWLLARRREARQ